MVSLGLPAVIVTSLDTRIAFHGTYALNNLVGSRDVRKINGKDKK